MNNSESLFIENEGSDIMAKSFADSLNALYTAQTSTMSLRSVSTLAAEEESWTLNRKYDTTDEFNLGKRYEDEHISFVDEKKNVKVNDYQVNLTQEENSQYIPFEMNRYYDGIDLMGDGMEISFFFENIEGGYGSRKAINVRYNDTKIRVGFLVPKEATLIAGKLKFEIHVIGSDPFGGRYVWKTKTNDELTIIESLQGNGDYIIDPGFAEDVLDEVKQAASDAKYYSSQTKTYLDNAKTFNEQTTTAVNEALEQIDKKIADVEVTITENVITELSAVFYTKEETEEYISQMLGILVNSDGEEITVEAYVKQEIANADIDNKLTAYAKTEEVKSMIGNTGIAEDGSPITVVDYINSAVEAVDISDELGNLVDSEGNKLTVEEYVLQKVDEVDISEQLNNYYTKDVADDKFATKAIETTANNNAAEIKTINASITSINEELATIDKSPKTKYRAEYGDVVLGDGSTAQYMFTLWKEENGIEEVQDRFQIAGGGGGSSSSVSMKISYVEDCPQYPVFTVNDKVIIKYYYEGVDSAGDFVGGTASWKIGNKVVLKEEITSGENFVDLTDYISTGDTKIKLSIEYDVNSTSKEWTVKVIDLKLSSNFDNKKYYEANSQVEFNFIPTGSVEKTVHFNLAGQDIGSKINSAAASGRTDYFVLPAQKHGSYLLDVYMTADINGKTVPSNHLYKDIVWFDSSSTIPVIGCDTQVVEMTQYNSINIKYTVFDPSTETPEVSWYVDDEFISTETLTQKDKDGYYTYSYKANEHGTFVLKAVCGESEPKIITVNVAELSLDVAPVTTGLAFDFDPTPLKYSNSSSDRLWSDRDVSMTVSDNFDWVNGGYQVDENGDKYFCVKAGTNAVINHNLFADAAQTNGKEFKVIFRTKNIRKRDTSFLTCMDNGIGLDMKVEHASVHCSDGALKSLYCEDAIIEYEFNINKSTDMMIAMTYEDGTPNIPYEYTETTSFRQSNPQPITIGSDDCDIHIYRMKAYKTSLTDEDIMSNFISDARNADEKIKRYNKNQIYNEDGKIVSTSASGDFNADALMKAAPELRYIFLEVPYFTTGKNSKVDGCSVYYRYPAGKRPEDNWDCTGMRHRGQGTSSDSYGASGRNVDLCMDRDTSLFTWTNEDGEIVESSTITLTDTSYPTDYLNIKVNIASSENENNAQMARRFNQFQPFLRYIRKKDSRVKDTMEFYNCVLFIRETDTDLTTHSEFNDCDWHYYALGNVGDSKKTDDTRVNNANDPREFVVELMDVDKPLSAFPTGKDNNETCPVSEWKSGNSVYDVLYSTDYVYDDEGKFESFGGTSYEFRYEMEDITEEQREININVWRDFYKFLATSTDEEIYTNLKKYFVVDSALYYYLFTERYTMVDNRAKNSFWHYGKVYISNIEAIELGSTEASYYIIDDEMASFNDGYRFDLTMGYDFDTRLGLDNTGDLVFSYGKEDVDSYDNNPSKEAFRVSNSRFFCKLRDLFPNEMQALYKDREDAKAWSAESLIKQWDDAQAQFPEELWKVDFERKYKRPYLGISVDNSIPQGVDKGYLIGKFFGRKKYQRRMFDTNQEIYYATRFFGNTAKNDQIWFRGNKAPDGAKIKQDYSLTITPYSDMYVCVQYTSTGTPIHKRMKAGETHTFVNNAESMDFMYIYAASYIQEIGDLSRCYIDDNSFTAGVRLRRITIGSQENGYDNPFMTNLAADNNPILEYLDLRNISGLNSILSLSSCGNLKELYAEGTNVAGAIFANGGLLETAHLPAIKSLLMKNLNYLQDFNIAGYNNLESLTIENCPAINSYIIVESAPLKELRLIGINWDGTYNITDSHVLDKAYTMWGRDGSNNPIDNSVLTGYVYIDTIEEKKLEDYTERWSDLDIDYHSMIRQFPITFLNDDGEIIEVQYVNLNEKPVDPITREDNPKPTPTKTPTDKYEYIYTGWDREFEVVGENNVSYVYRATYASKIRRYTVEYITNINNQKKEWYSADGDYGTVVEYQGELPTYIAGESSNDFYLFERWDNIGYVDGKKTVTAVFDHCHYTNGYFNGKEFNDLRPVEKYALLKLNVSGLLDISEIVENMDALTFRMSNDYNFYDAENNDISKTFIDDETMVFTGSNKFDTGELLLNVDKSFVLAVDYEFASGNADGATLMQCYHDRSTRPEGFRLYYSASNPTLLWNEATEVQCATGTNREMIVLRHVAGETGLHVYMSNLDNAEIGYIELAYDETPVVNFSLVFGGRKVGNSAYEHYAKGSIHWAKLWNADLGDAMCRDIASYTRENISTQMCGYRRKFIAGEGADQRCNLSFLATHILRNKQTMHDPNESGGSSSNIGGWGVAPARTWLNNRFYNGLPLWMKQLIKPVSVKYSQGNGSTTVASCDCYIYLPAYAELFNDSTSSIVPYKNEEIITPSLISYMENANDRVRVDHLGNAVAYTTRSASDYVNAKEKYFYAVTSSGNSSWSGNSTQPVGLVIEFCM